MYNVKSLKAEEFISDEEILDTLAYADANKDNVEVIDAILAKAEEEARIKKEQAQRDIEVEKNRVSKEIWTEIVDVALEVAKKVVGREVEGKDTDRLVDEFLKDN